MRVGPDPDALGPSRDHDDPELGTKQLLEGPSTNLQSLVRIGPGTWDLLKIFIDETEKERKKERERER